MGCESTVGCRAQTSPLLAGRRLRLTILPSLLLPTPGPRPGYLAAPRRRRSLVASERPHARPFAIKDSGGQPNDPTIAACQPASPSKQCSLHRWLICHSLAISVAAAPSIRAPSCHSSIDTAWSAWRMEPRRRSWRQLGPRPLRHARYTAGGHCTDVTPTGVHRGQPSFYHVRGQPIRAGGWRLELGHVTPIPATEVPLDAVTAYPFRRALNRAESDAFKLATSQQPASRTRNTDRGPALCFAQPPPNLGQASHRAGPGCTPHGPRNLRCSLTIKERWGLSIDFFRDRLGTGASFRDCHLLPEALSNGAKEAPFSSRP